MTQITLIIQKFTHDPVFIISDWEVLLKIFREELKDLDIGAYIIALKMKNNVTWIFVNCDLVSVTEAIVANKIWSTLMKTTVKSKGKKLKKKNNLKVLKDVMKGTRRSSQRLK